jgi:pyruvate ferredoxin oxidoreductase gamma subunit
LGKGFVVSGGTAALDSVVERKFKHKQELLEKNMATVKAGWDYAMEHKWILGKTGTLKTPVSTG